MLKHIDKQHVYTGDIMNGFYTYPAAKKLRDSVDPVVTTFFNVFEQILCFSFFRTFSIQTGLIFV